MKKGWVIILLIPLFLISCGKGQGRSSHRDLIPKDKFVDILVEIHMMDAITNGPEFYRKFDTGDSINIHEEIFRKYDVTQAQFDSTYVSYSRKPEKYLKIYDDVILKLNLKLDQLKDKKPSFTKEEEEKKKNES